MIHFNYQDFHYYILKWYNTDFIENIINIIGKKNKEQSTKLKMCFLPFQQVLSHTYPWGRGQPKKAISPSSLATNSSNWEVVLRKNLQSSLRQTQVQTLCYSLYLQRGYETLKITQLHNPQNSTLCTNKGQIHNFLRLLNDILVDFYFKEYWFYNIY